MRILKYFYPVIVGVILSELLIASVLYYNELNPVIAAIFGLLFTVPVGLFWESYRKPELSIIGKHTVSFLPGGMFRYMCQRIIIENSGRSAAANCKGYIVVGDVKELVCWTVPAERPTPKIEKVSIFVLSIKERNPFPMHLY
jgi:hypothetical protein